MSYRQELADMLGIEHWDSEVLALAAHEEIKSIRYALRTQHAELDARLALSRSLEREDCADLVFSMIDHDDHVQSHVLGKAAEAIRARKNAV